MPLSPMKVMLPGASAMAGVPGEGGPRPPGLVAPPPGLENGAVSRTPWLDSQQRATRTSHQAAALPAQAGFKEGWKFVWCHERCHKEENEKLNRALRRSVQAAGGTLFCLKKAATFGRWLEQAAAPPAHVLVTDWREAQPCVELLLQGASSGAIPRDRHPLGIVVLCGSSNQFGRASEWAQHLPPAAGRVLAVDIHGYPPASLGEPLRSLIFGHFPCWGAGTQPPTRASPKRPPPPRSALKAEAAGTQPPKRLPPPRSALKAEAAGPGPAGGETPPTAASEGAASEGEDEGPGTPARLEEAHYGAVYSDTAADLLFQGAPVMESIDWALNGPDAGLAEVLRRYGAAAGAPVPMEHIYENACRIRL